MPSFWQDLMQPPAETMQGEILLTWAQSKHFKHGDRVWAQVGMLASISEPQARNNNGLCQPFTTMIYCCY